MSLIETMAGLKYLQMAEVPEIPTRKTPLQVAVYAPLDAVTSSVGIPACRQR
jgi:hypothetical protein